MDGETEMGDGSDVNISGPDASVKKKDPGVMATTGLSNHNNNNIHMSTLHGMGTTIVGNTGPPTTTMPVGGGTGGGPQEWEWLTMSL